jgi:biotin operon repressor
MAQVWETPTPSHTAKLVLLAIADNANDSGECWPSITTLAAKCSLSRQGILDQIEKLQAVGLLEISRGHGRSNRYKVVTQLVNDVDQSIALTSQPHRPVPVNRVDQSANGTSQPYRPPVVYGVDQPVYGVDPNRKEPSFEPESTYSQKRANGARSESMTAKTIASIYPRRDAPVEVELALCDDLASGEDAEAIEQHVRECAAGIDKAEGGKLNKYIPSAKRFFTERLWRDSAVFAARFQPQAPPSKPVRPCDVSDVKASSLKEL